MNEQNPYQPVSTPSVMSNQQVMHKLKAPGISLIVVGATGGLLMIILLGLSWLGAAMQPELATPPAEMPQAEKSGYVLGYYGALVAPVFNILPQAFVVFAGISMLRRSSLGMARFGSILAVIPCLSPYCLLGIPFGLWSLVVLSDPDIAAGFESKQ